MKEQIGNAVLYLGDCMELMRQYPDKHFDLAIVDPPYGSATNFTGGGWETLPRSRFGGRFDKYHINPAVGGRLFMKYGDGAKHWDFAPSPEYFRELFRVSEYQIIWGGNYFDLPPSRNFIVWKKLTISENFSMAMAEYAWTNIKGNAKIFEHPPQDKERFHPTQKPVALYKWLLSKYAKPGDKILDTHFGSGSSVVACNEMGFSITASEIDEYYFNEAVKRIKQAAKQPQLFYEGAAGETQAQKGTA